MSSRKKRPKDPIKLKNSPGDEKAEKKAASEIVMHKKLPLCERRFFYVPPEEISQEQKKKGRNAS